MLFIQRSHGRLVCCLLVARFLCHPRKRRLVLAVDARQVRPMVRVQLRYFSHTQCMLAITADVARIQQRSANKQNAQHIGQGAQ
ncbi:hypothetical protein D3C71_915140 [compost metagenome]